MYSLHIYLKVFLVKSVNCFHITNNMYCCVWGLIDFFSSTNIVSTYTLKVAYI